MNFLLIPFYYNLFYVCTDHRITAMKAPPQSLSAVNAAQKIFVPSTRYLCNTCYYYWWLTPRSTHPPVALATSSPSFVHLSHHGFSLDVVCPRFISLFPPLSTLTLRWHHLWFQLWLLSDKYLVFSKWQRITESFSGELSYQDLCFGGYHVCSTVRIQTGDKRLSQKVLAIIHKW